MLVVALLFIMPSLCSMLCLTSLSGCIALKTCPENLCAVEEVGTDLLRQSNVMLKVNKHKEFNSINVAAVVATSKIHLAFDRSFVN